MANNNISLMSRNAEGVPWIRLYTIASSEARQAVREHPENTDLIINELSMKYGIKPEKLREHMVPKTRNPKAIEKQDNSEVSALKSQISALTSMVNGLATKDKETPDEPLNNRDTNFTVEPMQGSQASAKRPTARDIFGGSTGVIRGSVFKDYIVSLWHVDKFTGNKQFCTELYEPITHQKIKERFGGGHFIFTVKNRNTGAEIVPDADSNSGVMEPIDIIETPEDKAKQQTIIQPVQGQPEGAPVNKLADVLAKQLETIMQASISERLESQKKDPVQDMMKYITLIKELNGSNNPELAELRKSLKDMSDKVMQQEKEQLKSDIARLEKMVSENRPKPENMVDTLRSVITTVHDINEILPSGEKPSGLAEFGKEIVRKIFDNPAMGNIIGAGAMKLLGPQENNQETHVLPPPNQTQLPPQNAQPEQPKEPVKTHEYNAQQALIQKLNIEKSVAVSYFVDALNYGITQADAQDFIDDAMRKFYRPQYIKFLDLMTKYRESKSDELKQQIIDIFRKEIPELSELFNNPNASGFFEALFIESSE